MKTLFEFKCSCCEIVFEALTEYTKTYECPECGKAADKIISLSRVSLEGYSGSFPGAADSWARKHEQAAKKEIEKARSL